MKQSAKQLNNQKQFECIKCSYVCCKKSDYTKHLQTKKHRNKSETNETKKSQYNCNTCNAVFDSRTTLWRHKKGCDKKNPILQEESSIPPSTLDPSLVLEILKQNNEFKEMISEQSKQILELSSKVGNNNNNTINSNNKFNLNFFLNEQCKDAMNIEDFIDSLQLELEDLTETKRLGFVQGISRIFTNKLQELDIYSRPLHCTDIKRETVYIKDDNQWEKDNQSKDKLKSIVNKVATKNYQQLPKWQEKHPNYLTMDTQECDDFMDITCKALGGKNNNEDDKFKQRIMKNVLKEVTLDKM